jgi:hypothetical protein
MKPYTLLLLLVLFLVTACGEQTQNRVFIVEELQEKFEQEGFTFTELPPSDIEPHLGPIRNGISSDGFIQVQIYGNNTPTRVALGIRGLSEHNRIEHHIPKMVMVAQTLVPEWGDANVWFSTQAGMGQNRIQHHVQEHRGNYDIQFSATRNVLTLMMMSNTVMEPA